MNDMPDGKNTLSSRMPEGVDLVRNLIEISDDLVFVKDRQLRTVLCNERCASLIGKKPEDLEGKTDLENGWPPELVKGDPSRGIRGYEQDDSDVLGGATIRRSSETAEVNGETLYFDTVKSPLKDPAGNIVGVLGVSRNVTGRVLAEKNFQDALVFVRNAVSSAGEGIVIYDRELRYQEWNPFMERITGMSRSEVIGRKACDIFPHLVEQRVDQLILKALSGLTIHSQCTRYWSPKTGQAGWVSATYTPHRDGSGRIVGVIGLIREITEHKLAEETLKQSEERYRLLFNSGNDAVFVHEVSPTQPPGRFTEVNDVACQRLGYTRDELLRMCPGDLDAPETAANVPRMMTKLFADKAAIWEGVHIAKDGRRIPVEISNRLFISKGRNTVVAVVRDISERKRAELSVSRRATFDAIITGILAGFAACRIDDVDEHIRQSLEQLGLFTGVDNAFVIMLSPDRSKWSVKYNWHLPGTADLIAKYQNAPIGTFPWIEERLLSGNSVVVDSIASLPAEAVIERRVLGDEGIQSFLQIPLHGRGGHVSGCIGLRSVMHETAWLSEDISRLGIVGDSIANLIDRKQAEDSVIQSEQTLRDLINASPDAAMLVDVNWRIVALNDVAAKRFNKRPSEVVGSVLFNIAPPEIAEARRRRVADILESKTPVQWQDEWNGRYTEHRVHPVLDKAGNVINIAIFASDITEQVHSETALRESELRFRKLIENSPIAIGLSRDAKTIYVNRAYLMMFGYTDLKDVEGSLIVERFAPQCRADIEEKMRLRKEGKPVPSDYETTGQRRDGTQFPMQVVVASMELAGGLVTIGFMRDITQQKKAEERERQHVQQLIQADRLVSLGTLVAGMAHEINNPNMFIMLNTPLLQEVCEDLLAEFERTQVSGEPVMIGSTPLPELKEIASKAFDNIVQGSERIKRIVDELKDFAREKPSELKDNIDINQVINSAITLTWNKIKNTTDGFVSNCPPGLPLIRGNAQRLEQVMINLIVNACDALTDRKQGICISTTFDSQARAIIVSVADKGAGMTPEVLARIRDPFFTTKRDSGGTGLGVSISSRVIADHGGSLNYESAPGAGTTVTVVLPVMEG